MSEIEDDPTLDPEGLYAGFLELHERGDAPEFEVWVADHPGCEGELRRFHDDWLRVQPLFERMSGSRSRSGLFSQSLGRQLDPGIELVPESASDSDLGFGELLGRLRGHGDSYERYRVKSEIGRGGMGVVLRVWDAELKRHLAMKLVKREVEGAGGGPRTALDTATLGRFLEEAQITAQLEHPGIVPVHELGLDPDGRVYFTMRMVQGESLARAIERVHAGLEGWSQTRVLGEILKVCQALAYAHERGVVHRDIKPDNVMLGAFGEAYMMDWGLARLAAEPEGEGVLSERYLTSLDSPLATQEGQALGTPAYMSPEQACGDRAAVGPHSDIYSMGAILYHLLTARVPYVDPDERLTGRELIERVKSGPPLSAESLSPEQPPELLAICDKAMARDPAQRYASAKELSEDLSAFLENRVVRAHRTGPIVEFKKWVGRNRGLAVASAAAVFLAFSGVSATAYVQAEGKREQQAIAGQLKVTNADLEVAKREAEESGDVARRKAESLERVVAFTIGMFRAETPGVSPPGELVRVKDVLDQAAARIKVELREEPDVRATLMNFMGSVYLELGLYSDAEPLLVRSEALRRELNGDEHRDTLVYEHGLATLYSRKGMMEEADARLKAVVARSERVLGPVDPQTITAKNSLANHLFNEVDPKQGAELFLECWQAAVEVHGEAAVETRAFRKNYAVALLDASRYGEAEEHLYELYEANLETFGEYHPATISALGHLAILHHQVERLDLAEATYRDVLRMCEEVYGPEHPETLVYLSNFGYLLKLLRNHDEATEVFERTRKASASVYGPAHRQTLAAEHNYANLLLAQQRYADAEAVLRNIIATRTAHYSADHPDNADTYSSLANALKWQEKYEEAEDYVWMAYEGRLEQSAPDHPEVLLAHNNIANLYLEVGRYAEAKDILEETLPLLDEQLGRTHRFTQAAMVNLAYALCFTGPKEEAKELALELIGSTPPGHPSYDMLQVIRNMVGLRD